MRTWSEAESLTLTATPAANLPAHHTGTVLDTGVWPTGRLGPAARAWVARVCTRRPDLVVTVHTADQGRPTWIGWTDQYTAHIPE